MTRALDRGQALTVWALTVPVDFRIARARIRYSNHVLVRIRDGGVEGWGSAPLYARGTHELARTVESAQLLVPQAVAAGPKEGRMLLADRLSTEADVLSALDGALWDLEGRETGQSVATLLGGQPGSVPITEQLFVTRAEAAMAELAASRARGTKKIKLKLSGIPPRDIPMLERARDVLGPDIEIRVDVNRGYAYDEALTMAPRLRRLGIGQWEEPLEGDFVALARLRAETGMRLILDESIRTVAELDAALGAEAIDVLNVKLGRVGGITTAERFRHACASAGVEVSIGCAEDLGPGMAAILHAARAWNPVETEGLGWMRLGLDLASPSPQLVDGSAEVSPRPGWGLDVATGGALVRADQWTLAFRLQGWLRRQRQRAENVRVRFTESMG